MCNNSSIFRTAEIITLGSNIRKERLSRGLTQADFAKASGVALSGIMAYEKNKVIHPNPFTIQKIAKALQIKELDLFPEVPEDAKDAIDVICPLASTGLKIKNLRLRKRLQQKDLARMLGIHEVSLCRYEKDLIKPDEKMKKRIESLLSCAKIET